MMTLDETLHYVSTICFHEYNILINFLSIKIPICQLQNLRLSEGQFLSFRTKPMILLMTKLFVLDGN